MNDTIFKVGDRVYDHEFESWGTVKSIEMSGQYKIGVELDNGDDSLKTYTVDGRFQYCGSKSLSFTEYNYVTGGFSQERPEELPEKGQLVFVRDEEDDSWEMCFFSHKSGPIGHTFENQKKEGKTIGWNFMETENPLLK